MVINGGTFELQMGNTSDERLGSDPASFPPSEITLKLIWRIFFGSMNDRLFELSIPL